MRLLHTHGHDYQLPGNLNAFQEQLYIHLINWKWKNITKEPGIHKYKGQLIPYDAILPDEYEGKFAFLYPEIVQEVQSHLHKFPFRIHKFFNHMASSQAANINLFLPILMSGMRNEILGQMKPDFASVAASELDNGYRIEFWDEPYGNLGDKTEVSGTDSDLAIAYYNKQDELCLWLIEHKLTEAEFTNCGGYKSKGRQARHDCSKSFADILEDKSICYYHDVRHYNYWEITDTNKAFFPNHSPHSPCPFNGGLNQLWRNQLLGLSIEQDSRQPYEHVYFSVVHHPDNSSLHHSMQEYIRLINGNEKFSVFTSGQFIAASEKMNDPGVNKWIDWYKKLYNL